MKMMALATTQEQQQLQTLIASEMASLPRFIFRYWHDFSGGYSGLNTSHAITPSAFSPHSNKGGQQQQQPKPPPYYHQLNQQTSYRIANKHIKANQSERTVFSSWSQSLVSVLRMARNAEARGDVTNIHISILDTTLLGSSSSSNAVLHTVQMKRLGLCNISYNDELLAYGVIRGAAHQAVPFADFKALLFSLSSPCESATAAAAEWQRLVAVFRPNFRLAVTAFLVAILHHTPTTGLEDVDGKAVLVLVRSLAGLDTTSNVGSKEHGEEEEEEEERPPARLEVPWEWRRDPKILMAVELSAVYGLRHSDEAIAAARTIRAIVREDLLVGTSGRRQRTIGTTRSRRALRRRRTNRCGGGMRVSQAEEEQQQQQQKAKEKKLLRVLKQLAIQSNPKHFAPTSARSMRGIELGGRIAKN